MGPSPFSAGRPNNAPSAILGGGSEGEVEQLRQREGKENDKKIMYLPDSRGRNVQKDDIKNFCQLHNSCNLFYA